MTVVSSYHPVIE